MTTDIFVAAELGANWRGDYETLKRMCRRAQLAGCDAVKLQALSPELIARHPEWEWYAGASVDKKNIDWIDKLIQNCGIEWFCTPTYPECIEWINPYVNRWKIRYADKERLDILDKCIDTKKPVIISTDRPINIQIKNVQQIFCIPKYPTNWGELNFAMITLLPGYSNHCLDPLAILKAARFGAKYIEFHLSDDKEEFAIDNKVSFSYSQMDEILKWVKNCDNIGL